MIASFSHAHLPLNGTFQEGMHATARSALLTTDTPK